VCCDCCVATPTVDANDIHLITQARGFSALFAFRRLFLVLQAALIGTACRARSFSRNRRLLNSLNQFLQFRQTVGRVSTLVAEPLAVDHNRTVCRNPAAVTRQEPLLYGSGQRCRGRHVPVHGRSGTDFVHVLTSRTAGTRIREREFRIGNTDLVIHVQHLTHLSGEGFIGQAGNPTKNPHNRFADFSYSQMADAPVLDPLFCTVLMTADPKTPCFHVA
jgi:hypothetical protein